MNPASSSAVERARHPSARARGGNLLPLARRVVETGPIAGPHRDVAVAARVIRGRQGRTMATFAAAYGVAEGVVAELEAGWLSIDDVPAPVAVSAGLAAVVSALAVDPPRPK